MTALFFIKKQSKKVHDLVVYVFKYPVLHRISNRTLQFYKSALQHMFGRGATITKSITNLNGRRSGEVEWKSGGDWAISMDFIFLNPNVSRNGVKISSDSYNCYVNKLFFLQLLTHAGLNTTSEEGVQWDNLPPTLALILLNPRVWSLIFLLKPILSRPYLYKRQSLLASSALDLNSCLWQ